MCLTIPKQIISINKNVVKLVRPGSPQVENATSLVKVKKGDWVLTQNNVIIKKVTAGQAKEILKIIDKHSLQKRVSS